jgi:phosphatidylserine/phosphatidylglycerophosphate/cardiolipin synthase-like enzyme
MTDELQVLIADDRIVICGSANLNDRSQLGTHDSEIAIVVEDQTPVQSSMNGRPWQANRFAASLRRQLQETPRSAASAGYATPRRKFRPGWRAEQL